MAKQSNCGNYQTRPGRGIAKTSALTGTEINLENSEFWEESYDSVLGRIWLNKKTSQQVTESELLLETTNVK